MLGSFWGPRSALICRAGLRRHTDVGLKTVVIEVVAHDVDPGGNDVFDSYENGDIEGVGTNLDGDFKRWVRRQYNAGLRYLTVYEVE